MLSYKQTCFEATTRSSIMNNDRLDHRLKQDSIVGYFFTWSFHQVLVKSKHFFHFYKEGETPNDDPLGVDRCYPRRSVRSSGAHFQPCVHKAPVAHALSLCTHPSSLSTPEESVLGSWCPNPGRRRPMTHNWILADPLFIRGWWNEHMTRLVGYRVRLDRRCAMWSEGAPT